VPDKVAVAGAHLRGGSTARGKKGSGDVPRWRGGGVQWPWRAGSQTHGPGAIVTGGVVKMV
jgi:hypothetical protein